MTETNIMAEIAGWQMRVYKNFSEEEIKLAEDKGCIVIPSQKDSEGEYTLVQGSLNVDITGICDGNDIVGPLSQEDVDKLREATVAKDLLEYPEDEPEGLGSWMIEVEQKARVEHHIACEEQGYPASEAKYPSVKAWEEATGKDWIEYLNF